ncbi:hypothetical protein RIF29_12071 [Crotalaria pallida]|uniref:Flavin-containing monooxygenase n=1 Tax=Crotalaria pallida TaxID=3830 RepID=A0AAN9IMT3_CROPI
MTTKKVCIIGAGLSGLLACKYILAKGFHPMVFEANSYFPWPSSVTEDFPDQEQVMKYIIDYANHFDLLKYINFNTKVLGIEYEGVRADEMQAWHLWCGTGEPFNSKGKWKVSVLNAHKDTTELAVLGFSEGISNLYNSEMRSRWIAELLDGTFQLPSIEEMKKDVREWKEYMKKYAGQQYYKRTCIAGLNIHYNDLLCKDMGLNPRRKKGVFAELFEPYGPMD